MCRTQHTVPALVYQLGLSLRIAAPENKDKPRLLLIQNPYDRIRKLLPSPSLM